MSRRREEQENQEDGLATALVTVTGDRAHLTPGDDATPDVQLGRLSESDSRYESRSVLGRGGMGEVSLCLDRRLGRAVALKSLQLDGPNAARRFRREYAIQGQLEHPSIVPVYDAGTADDGSQFFTMKRVRGRTLREILRARAENDAETVDAFPLRRLLALFVQATQAVAYAHSRGVVHRDIKPENIMVGAFGEVYVLDWGVAKLLREDASEELAGLDEYRIPEVAPDLTGAGLVLGTPGYIPPEMVMRGASANPAADVFALGAILFELLVGQPLFRGNAESRLNALRNAYDPHPSQRDETKEIADELDAICARALAPDPAMRFEDARGLANAIEAFLNFEQNNTLRRAMSRDLSAVAAKLADEALREPPAAETKREMRPGDSLHTAREDALKIRSAALRHAGSALALDHENEAASTVIFELLSHEPKQIPASVERVIEKEDSARARGLARNGARTFVGLYAFLPFVFWLGVKDFALLGVIYGLITVVIIAGFYLARMEVQTIGRLTGITVLTTLVGCCTTLLFGPFMIVPGFVATNTLACALQLRRNRGVTVAIGVAGLLLTAGIEVSGIFSTMQVLKDSIVITSPLVHLSPIPLYAILIGSSLAMLLMPTQTAMQFGSTLLAAETSLHMRRWQLEQLSLGSSASSSLRAPSH